ncbi:MAG: alpha/beta fold hydrolase [Sphingomonadales bacterium]|nr:alpha/beta fold hydrolase [Sphingomonadales bacterium]
MKHWFIEASDGIRLAVHEVGEGRPLILIHGFVSDAATNWIKYGHAALLADAGFRVIMPDLRAHGDSAKPHDPMHYPVDILADDQFTLLAELGVKDFDLGGYSLGGRTVSRMLARGCVPRRAVIAGMGLEGLTQTGKRKAHFRSVFENLDGHERGSPEFMAAAFVKTTGADPIALNLLLDSFADTSEDAIRGFDMPVAVVCGEQDDDNGSAAALVAALPQGRHFRVPGNHMSAVVKPELGQAIAEFLLEDI